MNISPATWSALSQLLDEAFDLNSADRAAWLAQQENERPELAATLRNLLALHASSETADVLARLPRLSVAPERPPAAGLAAGDRVGPYRLKRALGTGGMADVWLAERVDGAFEREVALKVPRLTRLRPDLAQRFARERDILARLEHPHIARLYDAGVADGDLPYLAMELVDGRPITDYCDAQRLDVVARLHLFMQVLDAVQYAHANLVIHRDLKPSNILITADAQARLLDFGIAKLLADDDTARETQLTQISGRALTPDYASPEQIKGEPLTIASDVYSLGVVLYELLSGQRPYRLKLESAAQLEQAIVSTNPTRPSSVVTAEAAQRRATSSRRLSRALGGDLDTIVLKALAKAPAQRYATIAEFAGDLHRHRAGEPVHAQPASWRYRTRKFIARNRLAVVAATAIGVALVAATTVSLWQAQRARDEATRAEEVKRFVLSIFEGAELSRGGSRKTTAVELLGQARARLASTPVNEPSIMVELLTSVGQSLSLLGDTQQANPTLAEAMRLAVAHLGENDPHRLTVQLAYGRVLFQSGDLTRAAPLIEAAERGMRRTQNAAGLVSALQLRSALRGAQSRFDEAIADAKECVQIAEAQLMATQKRSVMEAHVNLARVLLVTRQPGRLAAARRAYELARELYGDGAPVAILTARANYASALIDEGDADAETGLSELKAIVAPLTELLGSDHFAVRRAISLIGLGSLSRADLGTAIESFRHTLRLDIAASGGAPTPFIGLDHLYLGHALYGARRLAEAEAELRRANEVVVAAEGADHNISRIARANLGGLLARSGRLVEADAIFNELLAHPHGTWVYAAAITNLELGSLRTAQGRHSEAQALLQKAADSLSKSLRPIDHAHALAALGEAQLEDGRASEALDTFQQSGALLARLQPDRSPDSADVLVSLARAHLALGRADEAVAAAAEATAFWSRFDPANRYAGIALLWHARALAATGDAPKAADTVRKAAPILLSAGFPGDRALLEQTQRELIARVR